MGPTLRDFPVLCPFIPCGRQHQADVLSQLPLSPALGYFGFCQMGLPTKDLCLSRGISLDVGSILSPVTDRVQERNSVGSDAIHPGFCSCLAHLLCHHQTPGMSGIPQAAQQTEGEGITPSSDIFL